MPEPQKLEFDFHDLSSSPTPFTGLGLDDYIRNSKWRVCEAPLHITSKFPVIITSHWCLRVRTIPSTRCTCDTESTCDDATHLDDYVVNELSCLPRAGIVVAHEPCGRETLSSKLWRAQPLSGLPRRRNWQREESESEFQVRKLIKARHCRQIP